MKRVERSIRYIRDSFFSAREFYGIERLNEEAKAWPLEISASRKWMQDDTRIVADVFAEERDKLRQLPGDSYPAYERKSASVGRTPWVRFDKNDYSLPPQFVRMRVDVLACHRHVRIVVDGKEVARHVRSFDRRLSVEDPAHTDELRAFKRKAHVPSAGERLRTAAPSAEAFLQRGAERGHNLGGLVSCLIRLLDSHGAESLDKAIGVVNERQIVSANAVRLVLNQNAGALERIPPSPVRLPRAELANMSVRAADLGKYDIDGEEASS